MPSFPSHRPRRLRRSETIRSLVRETSLHPGDLILPLFVVPGEGVRRPIGSMAGVEQTSADELLRDAEEALRLGIGGVLLFGIPEHKDETGSSGYGPENVVSQVVRRLKRELPGLLVMTDVCLCEYTSHGHCGVIQGGDVDNDATVPLLARMAVAHADAGADVVAPSDMMDGRVGAIRAALDEAGHTGVAIMAYSAKYASAFYGPFRDVAESAPTFGDRRTAQMDPGNVLEALREARLDVDEGADIVMVKPALAYLDVIHRVKAETGYPVCAYHVSGEYAMIVAAAERGWIDGDRAHVEALTSIKRAGADMVISYYARQFARRHHE
ncbi:MAG TPA: porphobilinogen synthase [Longimicrobium sp.]|jgi:porphobilinogen synthase